MAREGRFEFAQEIRVGVYLEEGQLTSVRGAHPAPRPRVRAESYIYVDHVLAVKYMCFMLMFTLRPRATSFRPNASATARHSPVLHDSLTAARTRMLQT